MPTKPGSHRFRAHPNVTAPLLQLERLELAVHEAVAGQTGVLTIGAINAALLEVLPELIEQLKERFPNISVFIREIDSGEAIPSLESGDIDVAFARIEGGWNAARQNPLVDALVDIVRDRFPVPVVHL